MEKRKNVDKEHKPLADVDSIDRTSNMNIEEEMTKPYVEAFRTLSEEHDEEEIAIAIKYLSRLPGGLSKHRHAENLLVAVDHIKIMKKKRRVNDHTGLPHDYTKEELRQLLDNKVYSQHDFDRVLGKFVESYEFIPSPKEFIELHDEMKGNIEELENTVKELQKKIKQLEKEKPELAALIPVSLA